MSKYRSRPIEISAFKYDGDFMNSSGIYTVPYWAEDALCDGILYFGSIGDSPPCELFIDTRCGSVHVNVGDYIVQETNGLIHAYKPPLFEELYYKVD